jgi:hypothetical protein
MKSLPDHVKDNLYGAAHVVIVYGNLRRLRNPVETRGSGVCHVQRSRHVTCSTQRHHSSAVARGLPKITVLYTTVVGFLLIDARTRGTP